MRNKLSSVTRLSLNLFLSFLLTHCKSDQQDPRNQGSPQTPIQRVQSASRDSNAQRPISDVMSDFDNKMVNLRDKMLSTETQWPGIPQGESVSSRSPFRIDLKTNQIIEAIGSCSPQERKNGSCGFPDKDKINKCNVEDDLSQEAHKAHIKKQAQDLKDVENLLRKTMAELASAELEDHKNSLRSINQHVLVDNLLSLNDDADPSKRKLGIINKEVKTAIQTELKPKYESLLKIGKQLEELRAMEQNPTVVDSSSYKSLVRNIKSEVEKYNRQKNSEGRLSNLKSLIEKSPKYTNHTKELVQKMNTAELSVTPAFLQMLEQEGQTSSSGDALADLAAESADQSGTERAQKIAEIRRNLERELELKLWDASDLLGKLISDRESGIISQTVSAQINGTTGVERQLKRLQLFIGGSGETRINGSDVPGHGILDRVQEETGWDYGSGTSTVDFADLYLRKMEAAATNDDKKTVRDTMNKLYEKIKDQPSYSESLKNIRSLDFLEADMNLGKKVKEMAGLLPKVNNSELQNSPYKNFMGHLALMITQGRNSPELEKIKSELPSFDPNSNDIPMDQIFRFMMAQSRGDSNRLKNYLAAMLEMSGVYPKGADGKRLDIANLDLKDFMSKVKGEISNKLKNIATAQAYLLHHYKDCFDNTSELSPNSDFSEYDLVNGCLGGVPLDNLGEVIRDVTLAPVLLELNDDRLDQLLQSCSSKDFNLDDNTSISEASKRLVKGFLKATELEYPGKCEGEIPDEVVSDLPNGRHLVTQVGGSEGRSFVGPVQEICKAVVGKCKNVADAVSGSFQNISQLESRVNEVDSLEGLQDIEREATAINPDQLPATEGSEVRNKKQNLLTLIQSRREVLNTALAAKDTIEQQKSFDSTADMASLQQRIDAVQAVNLDGLPDGLLGIQQKRAEALELLNARKLELERVAEAENVVATSLKDHASLSDVAQIEERLNALNRIDTSTLPDDRKQAVEEAKSAAIAALTQRKDAIFTERVNAITEQININGQGVESLNSLNQINEKIRAVSELSLEGLPEERKNRLGQEKERVLRELAARKVHLEGEVTRVQAALNEGGQNSSDLRDVSEIEQILGRLNRLSLDDLPDEQRQALEDQKRDRISELNLRRRVLLEVARSISVIASDNSGVEGLMNVRDINARIERLNSFPEGNLTEEAKRLRDENKARLEQRKKTLLGAAAVAASAITLTTREINNLRSSEEIQRRIEAMEKFNPAVAPEDYRDQLTQQRDEALKRLRQRLNELNRVF